MKKFILKFMMCLTLMIGCSTYVSAQNLQIYKSTSYSFALIDNYGNYTWNDWEKCVVDISMNLSTDIVTIYSNKKQIYYITATENNGNLFIDSSGGENIMFKVIDQDGDNGQMRLRIERNGNSQIYIIFGDCAWCYNVYRIR